MSGKPYNSVLIQHTISKIQSHWSEMRLAIHPVSPDSYKEKWFSQMTYLKQLSFHHSVCIALWDIVSNRFLFVIDERNVTGYDLSLYTHESGVDFSLSNFHPEHIHALRLMNHCMEECHRLYSYAQPERMMANLDALYRVQNGNYIHILQQIVPVETDDNGQPFLFLSYVRDITHLKKHLSSTLVFTTPENCKMWNYNLDKRELDVVMPFTAQEKKVLEFLSEGKQTRHIAETLSLSPHTVDTHRRRMLAKTNCVDTTALTMYCQLIGLI